MRGFKEKVRRFLVSPDGVTAVEYAIIAAGIAGALIVTIATLGGSLNGLWTNVSSKLN